MMTYRTHLSTLLLIFLFICDACNSGIIVPQTTPQAAQSLVTTEPVTIERTPPVLTTPLSRQTACSSTLDDGVSPSYVPNAPERTVVGSGHILTGHILSSKDCLPIPHARIEFWPEIAGQGHPESQRATLFSDANGSYRFECDQPEHIHMRISAAGYRTIGVNSYHPDGRTHGTFDIVLQLEQQ